MGGAGLGQFLFSGVLGMGVGDLAFFAALPLLLQLRALGIGDSRVLHARLLGRKESGLGTNYSIEICLLTDLLNNELGRLMQRQQKLLEESYNAQRGQQPRVTGRVFAFDHAQVPVGAGRYAPMQARSLLIA